MDMDEVHIKRVRLPVRGGRELRVSRHADQVSIHTGYADNLNAAIMRHDGQVIVDADKVGDLVKALELLTGEDRR